MYTYEHITEEYYSKFLGSNKLESKNGLNLYFNPDLDKNLVGYSSMIDIYIQVKSSNINISHGNKGKIIIDNIIEVIKNNCEIEDIVNKLNIITSIQTKHSIKYLFKEKIAISGNIAEILRKEHFDLFIDFFKRNNPKIKDYGWVNEYFLELIQNEYCHGIIFDNILVCSTDAPSMPFMKGIVQEIGINTLEGYRNKGYAQMACVSMIETLLSKKICPIWSAGIKNIGSQKLAKKIGFVEYFDEITIRIV
jgi:hypothetical protein